MAKRAVKKLFSIDDLGDEVDALVSKVVKTNSQSAFKILTKGGTRDDIIAQLSKAVTDTSTYTQTYVDTGLSVVGRERIADAAEGLGLKWYRYIGGVIKNTRDFCIERDGGYYDEEEIKSWADEDWDGKIDGTNEDTIFSYCGGWNCRHELIPVHESMVPK